MFTPRHSVHLRYPCIYVRPCRSRVFSQCKIMLTDRRNRLQIDSLRAVECIKSWDALQIGLLQVMVTEVASLDWSRPSPSSPRLPVCSPDQSDFPVGLDWTEPYPRPGSFGLDESLVSSGQRNKYYSLYYSHSLYNWSTQSLSPLLGNWNLSLWTDVNQSKSGLLAKRLPPWQVGWLLDQVIYMTTGWELIYKCLHIHSQACMCSQLVTSISAKVYLQPTENLPHLSTRHRMLPSLSIWQELCNNWC
jgi:hypothetical protein